MFNIGDKVIINDREDNPYTWTRPGSLGTIVNIHSNGKYASVQWTLLTGGLQGVRTFEVNTKFLSLVSESPVTSNPANKKYQKIITKMQQMEAKRKQLGYKIYGSL